MADITKTLAPGDTLDAGRAITFTVATTGDQEAAFAEGDTLIAWNTGAGAHTVTVYSAPDPISGRTNDITAESIAPGAIRRYGPFRSRGWKQSNGKLKFKANHAEVKFAVLSQRIG